MDQEQDREQVAVGGVMVRDHALYSIARAIDDDPALADEEWVALVAIATYGPDSRDLSCRLYDPDGTIQPFAPHDETLLVLIDQLREPTVGASDRRWDACRLRFERATGELFTEFHYDEQPPAPSATAAGPPATGRRRSRLWWLVTALIPLTALLAIFGTPISVAVISSPGYPYIGTDNFVNVWYGPEPDEGKLRLGTKMVLPERDLKWGPTPAEVIRAMFNPNQSVRAATGGRPREERRLTSEALAARVRAEEVVLDALGFPRTAAGAPVVRVDPRSPSATALAVGDVVVSVDGHGIDSSCALRAEIAKRVVGQTMTLTVLRDNRTTQVPIVIAPSGGRYFEVAAPGVAFEDRPCICFGGTPTLGEPGVAPGAGVVLAVALYDQLTAGDITSGRVVAGAGVLGRDGSIGSVQDIEQDVAAAERVGANIFFAPAADADRARAAAENIQIVPVETFEQVRAHLGAPRDSGGLPLRLHEVRADRCA